MLTIFLIFSVFIAGLNAGEKEISQLKDITNKFEDLKVKYVLERYPKYHSELTIIRQKLLDIKKNNKNKCNEEEWMKYLSISSIEKLMYMYNTESILFSLIPRIKESEIESFCDFVISHNQHDREELRHNLQIIQVTFDGIHQSETLHELDKVKRIIADSIELIAMVDEIVKKYQSKHKME